MKNKNTNVKKVIVVRHSVYDDPRGSLNSIGQSRARQLAVNVAKEIGNKKTVIWISNSLSSRQTAEYIRQHLSHLPSKSIIPVEELSDNALQNTPENAEKLWKKFSECDEEVLIVVTHAFCLICMDTQWNLYCSPGFAAEACGFALKWGNPPLLIKQITFDTIDQKTNAVRKKMQTFLYIFVCLSLVVCFVLLVYWVVHYLV